MAMRILSIDGGGIRGILPGMLLVALEKKLQDISQNPAARIADYFDLVAGTSTGAILCSAYVCPDTKGKPKFSAQEAVNFYLQDGDEIFDVGVWKTISSLGGASDEKYSAKELERVLKTAFGETKISELLRPTCFVSYDVSSRLPVIFKQHSALAKNRDFLVRDAYGVPQQLPLISRQRVFIHYPRYPKNLSWLMAVWWQTTRHSAPIPKRLNSVMSLALRI